MTSDKIKMYADYGEDHYIAVATAVAEVESECKIFMNQPHTSWVRMQV